LGGGAAGEIDVQEDPHSAAQLPPWLKGGGGAAVRSGPRRRAAAVLRRLRAPALLLAGFALGWFLHPPPPAPAPLMAAAPPPEPPACPPAPRCGQAAPVTHAAARPHAKAAAPHALVPLPPEGPTAEQARRDALRAFAQQKADELRGCLSDPGRGALRRVGAALEIDARGAVATVQILGGESASRAVDSCYAARLKSWRFPESLLHGDERLLVNFVL
jgi:hypothetical protein